MRYWKLINVFFVFLFMINTAAAFMSPSTLSMVAVSVGGFIWSILVIAGVNVLLFR